MFIQKNKCFKFEGGKRTDNCVEAVPICGWCAQKSHKTKEQKCTTAAKCRNCDGDHPSFSRECPEYQREKNILYLKEVNNITYTRAKTIYENSGKSRRSAANTVYASNKAEGDKRLEELIVQSNREWERRWNENNRRWQDLLDQTVAAFEEKLGSLICQLPTIINNPQCSDNAPNLKFSEHTKGYMEMQGVHTHENSVNNSVNKRSKGPCHSAETSEEDMDVQGVEAFRKKVNSSNHAKMRKKLNELSKERSKQQ